MGGILFLIETIQRKPIQMQVSQKKQTFSQFFSAFLKCNLNFEYFQKKKDESHS